MVKIHLTCSLPFFVLQFPVILLLFWLCLFFFIFFFKEGLWKAQISLSLYIYFLFLSPLPSNSRSPRPSLLFSNFCFCFCFFSLSLLCNRLIGATLLSLSSFWNGFLFLLKFYLSVSIKIHLIKNKKIIHW